MIRQPGLAQILGVHGPLRQYFEGSGQVVDQRVTNTADISGGTVGGLQVGGTGNTMTVTQTITPTERADILAKVAKIREELDGVDGAEALRASVAAIQKAASQPQATKQGLKDKVIEALTVAGATEGVQAAAALVLSQMLTLLG